jgi:hypothetical protein
MKKIIILTAIFMSAHGKQVTLIGPALGAFNSGTVTVLYNLQGKHKLSKKIHAGEDYTFYIPDTVKKITVNRSYKGCNAKGKFMVPCNKNILDINRQGNQLAITKPDLLFDDELPPLRTGMVYGWTWR